ncbi:carnitine acetyl transferase [Rhizoctonia solani AG-1 IA]|uniref:Carnitine acetyl transferase n=1 Tax=Thanatephorus cucumeris (strain AG1-IA) TaxID=983506 RepID=L8WLW8_THACA|nr:carnitine acetyl transferase [Rhizoctonia solani AG-1 IA]
MHHIIGALEQNAFDGRQYQPWVYLKSEESILDHRNGWRRVRILSLGLGPKPNKKEKRNPATTQASTVRARSSCNRSCKQRSSDPGDTTLDLSQKARVVKISVSFSVSFYTLIHWSVRIKLDYGCGSGASGKSGTSLQPDRALSSPHFTCISLTHLHTTIMLARTRAPFCKHPRLSLSLRAASTTAPMVTRSADWKSRAPAPLPNTKTFAGEAALPLLPVPDLDVSLDRLKATLKPLARSAEELKAAETKIEELRSADLAGKLQERLLQLYFTKWRTGCISYLPRFDGFTPHPAHLPQTTSHRAAALTRSAMLFRQRLKRGELTPDATKEGPMCMDTWRQVRSQTRINPLTDLLYSSWMFDCCRVPGTDGKDFSVSFAQAGDTGDSGHVVVIRNGRLWRVDASAPDGGLLGTDELQKQFDYIYQHSEEPTPGVGVLTSNNRDVWAKDYQALREIPANAEILREIESCAFIVCLDKGRPQGPAELSRASWHGGLKGEELGNRWVDKPCQFIVYDNGEAGFMGEHSVMDGTPTVRLCDEVLTDLQSQSFPHAGASVSSPLPAPTPLDFTLTSTLQTAIESARQAGSELVNSQDLQYLLLPYGKDVVKKFNVSPDSWAQLIIQLAFWRLSKTGLVPNVGKGELAGTYEAATTRKFRKGRTETIRVVSEEVKAFCEAMDSKGRSICYSFGPEERREGGRAREAGNAMGVDRHMFGLRHLVRTSEGETMPSIFSDPLYQRASKWTLSTSAIFSKHFPGYGWVGHIQYFGVAYMTGYNDRMQFTITSRKEMPSSEFREEIKNAGEELYALFSQAQEHQPSKAKM